MLQRLLDTQLQEFDRFGNSIKEKRCDFGGKSWEELLSSSAVNDEYRAH